ncbi:MAG TPA: hypothetical protein VM053_09200 [Gemmatimonadaceae bacterium]|nr:hypothetical protein [Gemmatimonadaceae bacterium]
MTREASSIKRILNILTVGLVVIGVFFWFRKPVIPPVGIPPALDAATSLAAVGPMTSSVDAIDIVGSNMFSASRAAPAARYTPPGAGGMSSDPSDASMQDEPAAPAAPPPRVYGTMTGPNGATALIEGDSAGASSRLYREGDRVGAYRIVKILPSSVVVTGPAGRVSLKVEQREERE